jgi:hypothetical protein
MRAVKQATYDVKMSWNNHMPSKEAATPRTAEEIICVTGEVTLIERRLAMLIMNPSTPWPMEAHLSTQYKILGKAPTVIIDPQKNVLSALVAEAVCIGSLCMRSLLPLSNLMSGGSSPTNTERGRSTNALRRFAYQDNANALPLTMLRLFLITTE